MVLLCSTLCKLNRNFSRVSAPLCFNIIQLFGREDETSFINGMGNFSIVPLFGNTFPYFFPAVLLLFVLLNICNVYGIVRRYLSDDQFYKAESNQMISMEDTMEDVEQIKMNK